MRCSFLKVILFISFFISAHTPKAVENTDTTPPAGNAAIINIRTKKNKEVSYKESGTIGYTQSKYSETDESFNFIPNLPGFGVVF